jgi:predicted transcriptional regulator
VAIPVKKVLSSLPKSRQKSIQVKAEAYIREYRSLQELRQSLGLTQTEVAERQGVRQVNISNLEKRTDMHISTLKKYIEALGGTLEINVRFPDKSIVKVKRLHR